MPHPRIAFVALLSCVAIIANVIMCCGSSDHTGGETKGGSTYSGRRRPNGIIARTKASDTKVSLSAAIASPTSMNVAYKVKYRSGPRPVGISILARRQGLRSPTVGFVSLGTGDTQSGTKNSLLPAGSERIEITACHYSRWDTPLGFGQTSLSRSLK
jgi:hypothetical protein